MLQKQLQTHWVKPESEKDKKQRIEGNKKHKEDRQEKLQRTRHSSLKDDIELINMFSQLGIKFLDQPREKSFAEVPALMQGKRAELVSQKVLNFLVTEFDAEVVDVDGRKLLNFPKEKPKGEEMSLINEVAEKSGQKRSVVKTVLEALLSRVRVHLKNDRSIRIPNFCRLKVNYRPAKEKRKGMNPFTRKEQWFKARPASNKLRITPLKALKVYVAEKIEVVAPPKKKKKGKKGKK